MFVRKRRGTLAQELGKTIGGVASCMGTFAFCKAAVYPAQPADQQAVSYGSAYVTSTGDLFAPFPAAHVHAIMWMGALLVIGGTLLRLKSYWRVVAPKEEA
jgi:hypothetical protein